MNLPNLFTLTFLGFRWTWSHQVTARIISSLIQAFVEFRQKNLYDSECTVWISQEFSTCLTFKYMWHLSLTLPVCYYVLCWFLKPLELFTNSSELFPNISELFLTKTNNLFTKDSRLSPYFPRGDLDFLKIWKLALLLSFWVAFRPTPSSHIGNQSWRSWEKCQ